MSVDGLGNPLRYILTAGHRHDISQAERLIDGERSEYVIADRGYDSDRFRQSIANSGAVAMIPSRSNRKETRAYDERLYKERHLVECFIGRIKRCRHIFCRFDKLADRYMGFLQFAGTLIWLK